MAKLSGLSKSSIGRIWKAFELKPHRADGFKLSNDPLFVEKVYDIIGNAGWERARACTWLFSSTQSIDRALGRVEVEPDDAGHARETHPRLRAARHDQPVRRRPWRTGCAQESAQ
jgi:hypothetical protein